MEFHTLGENCNYSSCNQLDFLPFKCDACNQIYCKEHYTYTNHQCPEAYIKDNKVPSCPICDQPILVPMGSSSFDYIINRHIENNCLSDVAIVSDKKLRQLNSSNKCSFIKCKQIELIPFSCNDCYKKFCITHRLPFDHNCHKLHKKANYLNNLESYKKTKKTSHDTKACDTKCSKTRGPSVTNLHLNKLQ